MGQVVGTVGHQEQECWAGLEKKAIHEAGHMASLTYNCDGERSNDTSNKNAFHDARSGFPRGWGHRASNLERHKGQLEIWWNGFHQRVF